MKSDQVFQVQLFAVRECESTAANELIVPRFVDLFFFDCVFGNRMKTGISPKKGENANKKVKISKLPGANRNAKRRIDRVELKLARKDKTAWHKESGN